MTTPTTPRVVRCRMTNRMGEPCTGEALDQGEYADVYICTRHAGLVMEMIQRRVTQNAKPRG